MLELAPPGPDRARRAIALFEKQLNFQRKISFNPELDSQLQDVLDKLPPRQSTLIRAAQLYSSDDVPWTKRPPDVHQITVRGTPDGAKYRYSLEPAFDTPDRPDDFSGMFALWPADAADSQPSSVIADLSGRLTLDTYGIGAIVDSDAALVREVYGDLRPPWDSSFGAFNHHDSAALARFRRDLPRSAERVEHYLELSNVVDEFSGPGGPFVLLNLNARVRPGSIEAFPHLASFYERFAPQVYATSTISDRKGNQWLRFSFDHGRIGLVMMVRAGMLTPFDSHYAPAGEPVDLSAIADGGYRAVSSIHVTRMGMDFGLDDLSYTTVYHRDRDSVTINSRMDAPPQVVAPPVAYRIALMVAGEFMRVLAEGNRGHGLSTNISSLRTNDGMVRVTGDVTGEFRYSATLGILARIGDAIADAHGEEVREEERKLGEEFLDAFAADFDNPRPAIIRLDEARAP